VLVRKNLVKVYDVDMTGSPKISNADIFPQRMLIWIDDNVFGSINLPQRFTDIKARYSESASDLNADLRSLAPDYLLKNSPSSWLIPL
jgi:hypothetical protein